MNNYCTIHHKFVNKTDCEICRPYKISIENCWSLRENIICKFCKKEITKMTKVVEIGCLPCEESILYYDGKGYDITTNFFCSFECFMDDIKINLGLI